MSIFIVQTDMRAIRRAYKRKYSIELIEAIMIKCGEASPLIAHIAAKETAAGQNKVSYRCFDAVKLSNSIVVLIDKLEFGGRGR